MKITKSQLRQIVEEELKEVRASMMGTDWASFPPRDFESHGECSMAVNQLHRTEELARKLQDMISKDDNLEEWVESKITKAQDYLSSVLNYMSGERGQVAELRNQLSTNSEQK